MIPYPFSAIVGQDDLKLALLLNAVCPPIGGVLVRGEKGTAKSTAVRGLGRLLPEIEIAEGCRYNCEPGRADCPDAPHLSGSQRAAAPLVELPVGASTDRVTGTLDIEAALTQGRTTFSPGLLAAAHRGVLYVDEVNLLADAVVDVLLDSAALGVNYVERDGVSVRHPSRFLLVGTMNPEEGELRPQLLDRFGITVHVAAPDERAEVVRRRMRYERDAEAFAREWNDADADLTRRIETARELLVAVVLPDELLERIALACAALGVDGMRADIVTAKTAVALAAWDGRERVVLDDVRRALELAIPHRQRRSPFDEPGIEAPQIDNVLDPGPDDDDDHTPPRGSSDRVDAPAELYSPMTLHSRGRPGATSGARNEGADPRGHAVGDAKPRGHVRDVSIVATLRAAAPRQRSRGRSGPGLVLRSSDLRETVRAGRAGSLVVFGLDASGSMGARKRMATTKAAVLSLLLDSYRRRDKVAVVTFRGDGARVLLEPTSSVEVGAARLATLATGGRTPLAGGLDRVREVVLAQRSRDAERRAIAVILTDGRANAGPHPRAALRALARVAACLVVDTEHGPVRLGLARRLADEAGVSCLRPEDLQSSLRLVLDTVA